MSASMKRPLAASIVLILGVVVRLTSGLQLINRGLTLLSQEDEFAVYFGEDSPYPNQTEIRFENIGFGAPGFEIEDGHNFTLLCHGERIPGWKLVWTSNSYRYQSQVKLTDHKRHSNNR